MILRITDLETPKIMRTYPVTDTLFISEQIPFQLQKLKLAGPALTTIGSRSYQGCQMVYFQTKNPNLGKRFRVLQWKRLAYVFYGHLVYLRTFGIIT
jgi:hypothetical protein